MKSNNEKHLNINIWRLISAIIIVNASGLTLRYFNLNPYMIIMGFRFHLCLALPLLIILNPNFIHYVKISFLKPKSIKPLFPLCLIILPLLMEAGGLYYLQKIDVGDPEYFYEFGISSINRMRLSYIRD